MTTEHSLSSVDQPTPDTTIEQWVARRGQHGVDPVLVRGSLMRALAAEGYAIVPAKAHFEQIQTLRAALFGLLDTPPGASPDRNAAIARAERVMNESSAW